MVRENNNFKDLDSRFRRDFKTVYDFTFRNDVNRYTSKSIGHIRNLGMTSRLISKIKYGGYKGDSIFIKTRYTLS